MFSDYKTRGFNLEDSQIERTDRLDRLVLVLSRWRGPLSNCASDVHTWADKNVAISSRLFSKF
jgi:hypothetical protein